MEKTPKIFISYSWSNPNHEDRVINLAERLFSNGVEVVIDKWDLKEGHDKFKFMESMVKSVEIDKVLIILDQMYSEKANQRSGGVGTETQIISPQIYADVSQEKFIPVVMDKDEEGNPFIPTYLEGRIYIDLSSEEQFEENYENLLRNLFKRPAYNKPTLGKAPSYLFEDTPMTHKTSLIVRSFNNQIDKNPKRVNSILRDFLNEFYDNLKSYSITYSTRDEFTIGKEIYDNVNLYTPLRNDFISFFDKLTKEEIDFDIEIVLRFLEKLPLLTEPQDGRGSWQNYEFDNFRFFIYELFLYLIAIGLKNENYKFIEELLISHYLFNEGFSSDRESKNFGRFFFRLDLINSYYNQTFSKTFISPTADLIIKRIPENLSIDLVTEADLLCHYIGKLNSISWFPLTYIYKKFRKFDFFDRLISKRHFEKVKTVFNVTTAEELKIILTSFKNKEENTQPLRLSNSFDSVTHIFNLVKIEEIGTTK